MITSARRLIRTALVACTLGGTALLAPIVSDARADVVSLSACSLSALSQPFVPWLDYANYELAPGGDFETPAWVLSGGAQRVPGSEPYAATGRLGNWSLSLPAGSSAQSPPTCVDAAHPSLRVFIAGRGSVAVNFVEGGSVIPVGIATAGGEWSPSPVMLTSSAVLGALSDGSAQVSVSFTGVSGQPQIDDVFIDPWRFG